MGGGEEAAVSGAGGVQQGCGAERGSLDAPDMPHDTQKN